VGRVAVFLFLFVLSPFVFVAFCVLVSRVSFVSFGAEDDYNVYSKPLFDRGEAGSVYRPSSEAIAAQGGGEEGDDYEKLKSGASTRFKPDKGFRGADAAEANSRDGPVQFAKERKGEE